MSRPKDTVCLLSGLFPSLGRISPNRAGQWRTGFLPLQYTWISGKDIVRLRWIQRENTLVNGQQPPNVIIKCLKIPF